jgi:hypothetical protein
LSFSRNYKNFDYKLINTIEFPFVTYKIKLFNNKIYIYDGSYSKIHEINIETGKIIQSHGKGKGKGPGEFNDISGWSVNKDTLYALERYQIAYQVVKNDSLIEYIKCQGQVNHSSYLGYKEALVFSTAETRFNPTAGYNFYKVNLRTGNRTEVLVNHLDGFTNSFSIVGRFTEDDMGNHVFVCDRAGYFMAFDQNGKHRFSMQTIDKTALVPPIEKEDYIVLDNTYRVINSHFFVYNNKLHLASKVKAESEINWGMGWRPIDVYSLEDGAYEYSFKTPMHPNGETKLFRLAIISEEVLLATDMEKIYVFKYK